MCAMPEWSQVRPGHWVGGWFALFLGAAVILALTGHAQEAVKLALAAGLLPALAFCCAALVINVRQAR